MTRRLACAPAPAGPRLARRAAWLLCMAAARLYRIAGALDRDRPNEDERNYRRALVARYGKLD